jgi:hypothetical protein
MGLVSIEVSDIKAIVESEIKKILLLVSSEYKINNKKLTDNIIKKWDNDLLKNYNDIIKPKKSRPINPSNYCLARKPDLKRCTRIKKINCDFCATHQFNCPFGRIDQYIKDLKEVIEKKKKSKSKTKDLKEIIEKKKKSKKKEKTTIKLIPKKIGDNNYFIDDKNHLFINEKINDISKFRYIGKWKESDQTINLK